MRKTILVLACLCLLFATSSAKARPEDKLFGLKEIRIAILLLVEPTETRDWFEQHDELAMTVSESAGTYLYVSKTDKLGDEQVLALRALLHGTNPPDEIEEAARAYGFGYYALFAAINHMRHLKKVPTSGQAAHQ